MKNDLQALMREAARLTRSARLGDATQTLQRALRGLMPPDAASAAANDAQQAPVDATDAPAATTATAAASGFVSGRHTHHGLARDHKLFVPTTRATGPRPLVVMLHGCTQGPDDFAAGTAMNELAQAQGFVVLYPAQAAEANPQRCWNWFKHSHQQRERGEPAFIASLTREVMQRQGIDPRRVYVAGLSAGAAMAAIVAATHPELFAALGVHSGLATGAATNLHEAMAAMQSGAAQPPAPLPLPTIVFHGDQDRTVHPRNGEQVLAAAMQGVLGASTQVEPGTTPNGRRYTRSVHRDAAGQVRAEHWLVHGAGHAWSGGRAAGSYTDAGGPDASREMLRFFLAHPHRQA